MTGRLKSNRMIVKANQNIVSYFRSKHQGAATELIFSVKIAESSKIL